MICSFLAPQRNGTSILGHCIASHPDVLYFNGLTESMANKCVVSVPTLVRLYPAILESIKTDKVILERNHLPLNEKFVPILANTDFKILVLVRSPREVILSLKKWANIGDGAKFAMKRQNWSVDQFIVNGMQKWVSVVRAYEDLKESNDTLLLRHEDICRDPRNNAKRLFQWLEISDTDDHIDVFSSTYGTHSTRHKNDKSYKPFLTKEVRSIAKSLDYDLT